MSDEVELSGGSNDFDAGFSGAPTETPGESEATSIQQEQSQEQSQEQVQEPKFRQITEEDYNKLMTSAAAVDEMKATFGRQVDTAFGKIGGLERVLKQFQEQTPNGSAVEITREDLAEISQEFGEDFTEPMLKTLQRVAGKMRGTGQPDKATPELIERIRGEITVQTAKETLAETHPDWESVIGNSFEEKPADKDFLAWMNAQPQEYRSRVLASVNPVVIGKAIDKFRDHQATLKKNAARQDRFDSAVTPKGDGGYEPPPDGDDAFNAGFNGR